MLLAHGDFADDAGTTASIAYQTISAGQPAVGLAFASGAGPAATARGIGLWHSVKSPAGATGVASGEHARVAADDGSYVSGAVILALKPAMVAMPASTWRVDVSPPYSAATSIFACNSPCNERLYVKADDALEALIIRWKPAHTAVSFSYL